MSLLDTLITESLANITTEFLGMEDIITLKLPVTDAILESKITVSMEQMTENPSEVKPSPAVIDSLAAEVILNGLPKVIRKSPVFLLYYPPFLAKLMFKQLKPRQIGKLVRSISLDNETERVVFKLAAKYVLKHNMTTSYGHILILAMKGDYESIFKKVLGRNPTISLEDFADIELDTVDFNVVSELVNRAPFDVDSALALVMNPSTSSVLVKALSQHPRMRDTNIRKEVLTTFLTIVPYESEAPNIMTFFENSYYQPKEIYTILSGECPEDETNIIQILLGLNTTIAGTTPYLWNKLSKQMEENGCEEAATLYRYRANLMKMKRPKPWFEYIEHMSTL